MGNISNIQNKICSLNINMNGVIINHTPILFRIHENGTTDINSIINVHKNKLLDLAYDHINSIDDIINITVNTIVYDIISETDEYDTYDIKIQPIIDDKDPRIIKVIRNKINEYSQLILKKINATETCETFVDAFNIVNHHNANKISPTIFSQYIMSCFNEEYGKNKFSEIANEIINKEITK